MRYGIFGDIHGNYDALETVLFHLERERVDQLICTGDVVGYGAEPRRCIQKIRELGCLCLAGNHDHAAINLLDIEFFNIYAKRAAQWTRAVLEEEEKRWLAGLPFVVHFAGFAVVHGSAHTPEIFNYIQAIFDAELSFKALDQQVLFYGHTHIPLTFFDTVPMTYTMDQDLQVDNNGKTLVNVGSVGQPRDEDPRAAFCIFDDEAWIAQIYRVEYDFRSAGRKIIDAGLPEALAIRLELGK